MWGSIVAGGGLERDIGLQGPLKEDPSKQLPKVSDWACFRPLRMKVTATVAGRMEVRDA